MQCLDRTLEDSAPTRKYPFGFTSARLESIRAGHDPDSRASRDGLQAVSDTAAALAMVTGLAKFGALIGRAVAAGQAQAQETWDREITTAQQQQARE